MTWYTQLIAIATSQPSFAVYYQDPLVNTLELTGMIFLVVFILLFSVESLRPVRRVVAILLALNHVAFLAAYKKAYSLTVQLAPLLDILHDSQGRTSIMLDITQLMLLYLVISHLYEKYREKKQSTGATHITLDTNP